MTFGQSSATTSSAAVAGVVDLYPWTPLRTTAGINLNFRVVTAGAAGTVGKFVVYSSAADGSPGTLIFESGDLDTATTGIKTASFIYSWVAGNQYWVGLRFSGTPSAYSWTASATPDLHITGVGNTARKSLRRTLAYSTAAPTSWVFTTSELATGLGWALSIGM